jgi:OOP family OmpA-OmpF porin
LALWVVVVLAALVWGVDNAESTLRNAAREQLAASGYDVSVDFSGRDARLIGTASSAEAAAGIGGLVDAIPGVRDVDNEIVIVEPEPEAMQGPSVVLRVVNEVATIRGFVPNEGVQADLVEAAQAQFGRGRVVDALIVSENVDNRPWLGRIRDVFAYLTGLRSGGFNANDNGFLLEGEVISEAAREAIVSETTLVLEDLLPVTQQLSIAVLPEPSFSAAGTEGTIVLAGTMPDSETIAEVVDAAQRLHPNTRVISTIQVADVAGSMWLDSISGLLDVVTRLEPWTVDVAAGTVTITGLGLDQDLVDSIGLLAAEVVADELLVVVDVAVDPAVVALQLTGLLSGAVLFEEGEAVLTDNAESLLDSAIDILRNNEAAALVVEGHTDNQGDPAANRVLSQQQAEAVVDYLISGGIEAARLSAIGFGDERPLASNATEEGRAQNRRIVFVIREGDG